MEKLYQIALTLLDGVGDKIGKMLYEYCGSAENIFKLKKKELVALPVGTFLSQKILRSDVLKRAEEELRFVERYKIEMLFYKDENYPQRLHNCVDSPLLLYKTGNVDLNNAKVLSLVGTRRASDYGAAMTQQIVEGFSEDNILIVSGLAYGIDTLAHLFALDCGLPTVAVLGHGLDRIYPNQNKYLAEKMLKNGGLLSDFKSKTIPDACHFPKRNRIVAGMCDAVVVIEAAQKGGALITADIANSYNKEVFAVPGRVGDEYSAGCNHFIKQNKAALVQSADDIKYFMNWDNQPQKKKVIRQELFIELSDNERKIFDVILKNPTIYIDDLVSACELPVPQISSTLLQLEIKDLIVVLPGKCYKPSGKLS
ncbi:DNA processing protein DprA [Bacteroidia bacterium]|nr:DNA processing protein DprA [Bacteroidia bacterium]